MTETLAAAWTGVLIALCGVATAVLGVLAVHLPRLVRTWLEARTESTANTRALRTERASDRAVQAAEEIGRARGLKGEQKLSLASELVQRDAPDLRLTEAALHASVARLRQSSSSSLAPVVLSTPPIGSSINVTVTSSSEPPPPLPAPAKVPAAWREEATTRPEGGRR